LNLLVFTASLYFFRELTASSEFAGSFCALLSHCSTEGDERGTRPTRTLGEHAHSLPPWPPSRPPPTTCWPSTSFSFHASRSPRRLTGESCALSPHRRFLYSTYLPSPPPSPLRPHLHLHHLSYSPGGNLQEQIYSQQSVPARYSMRTTSQRRRPSETTIPSGMSMGASGHKTGCSERSQRGVSKSSYIHVQVVFFPQSTDCLYAHIYHFWSRPGSQHIRLPLMQCIY
jgi:hypothetical protein